jgi:hypothetical protein
MKYNFMVFLERQIPSFKIKPVGLFTVSFLPPTFSPQFAKWKGKKGCRCNPAYFTWAFTTIFRKNPTL